MLATGLLTGACTSYRPVTVPMVAARDAVQLTLTAAGTADLVSVLGPGVQQLEGTVRDRPADGAIVLADAVLLLDDGTRRPGPRAPIAVPAAAIARVERRVVDKGRTRLTAAVIVGTFTAIAVGVLRSTRFRGQGQTGQGPGAPE